jgi:hypothetical protein
MPSSDVETWLEAGIAAVKAGDRAQARTLLLRVVEADDESEAGWLWLSQAVEDDDDRRICLENVLDLNPANEAARRGLAELGGVEVAEGFAEMEPTAVSLYMPETLIHKQTSTYDDVWERDDDLCAYCAQVISEEQTVCPGCGRKLDLSVYRYEKPSTNLHILWVLVLGVGQLYLVQALYDVFVLKSLVVAILPLALFAVFVFLSGAIYFRQFWAYAGAVTLLSLILFANFAGLIIPAEMGPEAWLEVGAIFDGVVNPLIASLSDLLRVFQITAVIAALYYAAFKAGPDFARVTARKVAEVRSGHHESGTYHAAATRAAERGEWATAVCNWQRAAAQSPSQISFQRQLAIAYAKLGFYQRSQDVLQSALAQTSNPEVQAQLNRLLDAVQRAQSGRAAAKESSDG